MDNKYVHARVVPDGDLQQPGITQRDALAFDIYARAVTNAAVLAGTSCNPGQLDDDVLDALATSSLRAADVFIKRRDEYTSTGK